MKKIFSRNLDYIALIATIFLFVIICGYSEAGIKKIPDLPNSAVIQNSDLLVFENQTTNKTNNILFSDLVANFPIPSLTDLSDVNLSSPVLDDVLHFNGTEWVNTPISAIAPSVQNGLSLISSNVELGGVLLHDTSIDGDANQFSLFYDQLKNFSSSTIDTYLYGSNSITLESDNNINLLSNGNLSGAVARNTDLRSIPDWDLTSDISGRIYSGNDVLDLSIILGANIRGTGFFNKRTSNNVSHYIFAGDTTGTGGTADEITLGMSDFGLTGYNSEIGLVRSNSFGNGEYRVSVNNPTAYYNFNVQNEDSLNELFANTGYTHSRTTTSQTSNYDYTSNNHYYELRFDDNGGEYLALNNRSLIGPENGYFNLYKTSAVINVTDGILSNGLTLTLTDLNVYSLNNFSNIVDEKILVRDDTTGDIKKSIPVTSLETKQTNVHFAMNGSNSLFPSANEFIICTGNSTGLVGDEIFLPSGTIDGQKIIIKVITTDSVRVKSNGGINNIELGTQYDIDGTVFDKPSITFVYDSTINNWLVQ